MGPSKPPPQEMVQVESSEKSTSPFWRSRSANTRHGSPKPVESGIVVGASYSHADMLKFDSLSLTPSNSRPHTPPSNSAKSGPRHTSTPPPRPGSGLSSPPKRPIFSSPFGLNRNHSWRADDANDVYDADEQYQYDDNDEEDEFGLPSLSSIRRNAKRIPATKAYNDPGGTRPENNNASMKLLATDAGARPRANSSDIAEERGPPSYPTTKKSDGKILRPQYKEILRDPANTLHLISHPPLALNATPKEAEAHSTRISRINKFKKLLQSSSIPLSELRDSAWSGIPEEVRAISWQLLLGYLPTSSERRVATLDRKRKEYLEGVRQAFERGPTASSVPSARTSTSSQARSRGLDEALWHQISIDVPRTSPHLKLYSYEATQRSLERILYVWAIRHPASGYVQGINDLVTPFWQVFLGSYITDSNIESGMDPGQLPKPVLDAVEADSFWCLSKLLDGIQDNYIFAQPGIVRQVGALKDLTTRIDSGLAKHLENEGVEFMQFSFRWVNCLLMREVSVRCIIRMWDTYMAEEQGFSDFHLYVCAAFLVKWSDQLVKMEFQDIMMYLQALPTRDWTEKDIELLLSEAFIWQSLFRGSSAHLRNSSGLATSSVNI
ncbi:MAG: hypothetical protein Q9200_004904 [Gallowayella weberi]